MKKIAAIIVLSFVLSFQSFSTSFYLGGMGSLSTTWLLNSNISNFDQKQDYVFSVSPSYGPSLAFYFKEKIGVEFDVLFGKYIQKYNGNIGGTMTYASQTELKTLDVPFVFKFGDDAFFELGVQYTSVRSATYSCDDTSLVKLNGFVSTSQNFPGDGGDVTYAFNKSNFAVILGLGGNIELAEKFYMYLGFRFGYGLTDIQGTDAFANQLNEKDTKKLYDTTDGLYNEYKETHPTWANFRLGLSYKFEK